MSSCVNLLIPYALRTVDIGDISHNLHCSYDRNFSIIYINSRDYLNYILYFEIVGLGARKSSRFLFEEHNNRKIYQNIQIDNIYYSCNIWFSFLKNFLSNHLNESIGIVSNINCENTVEFTKISKMDIDMVSIDYLLDIDREYAYFFYKKKLYQS